MSKTVNKISTDNAQHYAWGEGCDGWHLAASETLSVIQERVPPGRFEVSHWHVHAEQFFYVLSGKATMIKEGEVIKLNEGEGVHIPAGCVHQLKNDADVDLVILVTSTPPSHGDRVLEASP